MFKRRKKDSQEEEPVFLKHRDLKNKLSFSDAKGQARLRDKRRDEELQAEEQIRLEARKHTPEPPLLLNRDSDVNYNDFVIWLKKLQEKVPAYQPKPEDLDPTLTEKSTSPTNEFILGQTTRQKKPEERHFSDTTTAWQIIERYTKDYQNMAWPLFSWQTSKRHPIFS